MDIVLRFKNDRAEYKSEFSQFVMKMQRDTLLHATHAIITYKSHTHTYIERSLGAQIKEHHRCSRSIKIRGNVLPLSFVELASVRKGFSTAVPLSRG